ncbi:NAD-dependent epimerase/dehydratase family protein [Xanthomonas campestris]|uniref:NAD-dependent epimerase/dehydratase family protein n=1 Tax=Xanthomonas campestris TaxID=339 RepID=UPI001E5D0289|nr:NAD-dependent epimerase/dehydratase family protein [Xanthomonas campestris]
MKIFLTGSSGCLASVLLPALVADTSVTSVTGIDIVEPGFADPKFTHVTMDMRNPEVHDLMRGHDAVIHLAFAVKRGRMSLPKMTEINVGGSQNVIDAAIAEPGTRRRGASAPILDAEAGRAKLADSFLNERQRQAATEILASNNRIIGVQGLAAPARPRCFRRRRRWPRKPVIAWWQSRPTDPRSRRCSRAALKRRP